MMTARPLASRAPSGDADDLGAVRDPEVIASCLSDAAHFPHGRSPCLYTPGSEAAVAAVLARHDAVLPIGAQSSLTGGATPMGEVLISTRRLNRVSIGDRQVRVGAGVTLTALDARLQEAGRYYPPVPTFLGACAGGIVSTSAAGAATFKYGTTRDWVEALTIVLPSGDALDVQRGVTRADPSGCFELALRARNVRIPVPRYVMPAVPKLSAGFYARPGMDLIDLFIGAEGLLGVITAATLRVLPRRPAVALCFVAVDGIAAALRVVRDAREQAMHGWSRGDPAAIDVSAIEYMDARCLALVREDGADRLNGVVLPEDGSVALLLTIELPAGTSAADAYDQLGSWDVPGRTDTALGRVAALLADHGLLDRVQVAVPGETHRAAQLLALREAVPAGVNRRIGLAQARYPAIAKVAADVIVPFDRTGDLLAFCGREFASRGIDGAVWGHVSDGNLHPNVIPRSPAELREGQAAVLAIGREAIRLGGAPLAEHGVGRHPVKQQLLAELYGSEGIEEMRRVKRAIDPEWKLAPGVVFAR